MTNPQGNGPDQQVDTGSLSVQQWKEQVPLLLDGRGRAREKLRRFVTYLADFANPDGTNIFPSVDRVAEHMHTTRRTVFRLYREAEDAKQIIRDGRGPKGTIRVRLNMDLPMAEGWLPYDAAAEHRRKKAAERWARYKANHAGGDAHPVVEASGGDTYPVVSEPDNAVCVTRPSIGEHQKDEPHLSSAAADAPPAGPEVIEAEIVEDAPTAELATRPAMLPNRSASWLIPEELPKGKRKPAEAQLFDSTRWPDPREADTLTGWTRKLVDVWSQASIEQNGSNPSGRMFGQAGREIRALIAAGNNPNHVFMACQHAGAAGKATITWSMQHVNPARNWATARPGKQLVTSQGVVTLPEGTTNAQRRALSIEVAFAEYGRQSA